MDEAKPGLSEAFSKGQEAINSCLDGVEDEDALIQVLWSRVLLKTEAPSEDQDAQFHNDNSSILDN